ncbi:MAG TPA: hypothetical protein PKC29_08435 [Thermodesulfobacteriota bacterium]|nr:hypothetical protein [Thermodesulfobacteriota bacterium]
MNLYSFRKAILLSGFTAAALFLLSFTTLAAEHASTRDFPECFIGTFLVEEGNGTQSLWTFGPGGVMFITSSAQKALDFTDEQGAWKKTGRREAIATTLDFSFNADGSLANIARVNIDVTFSGRGCADIGGAFTVSFYAPGVDPLDPDSVPENVVSDTFTGRRVQAGE